MLDVNGWTSPAQIVVSDVFAASICGRAMYSSLAKRARRTGAVFFCLLNALVACSDEVPLQEEGIRVTRDFPLAVYKLHKSPKRDGSCLRSFRRFRAWPSPRVGACSPTMTREESFTN